MNNTVLLRCPNTLYLSKHQEEGFTPVNKVPKLIVCFWDLLVAIKK